MQLSNFLTSVSNQNEIHIPEISKLTSTNGRKHASLSIMGLGDLKQNDYFQYHLLVSKFSFS